MSLQSPAFDENLALIHSGRTLAYNTVAAGAFIFWEYCITFTQEVDYVWRRKWGVINYLFLLIRYGSFFVRIAQLLTNLTVHPSMATCKIVVKLGAIGGHVMLFAIDILLGIRTYAFYGRNRKMLFLLIAIILAGQAASITILAIVLPSYVSNAAISGYIGACEVIGADPRSPQYFLITLVVEGLLTLFVATKFLYDKVMGNTPTSHTLLVFIRDGAWAFGLVFAGVVWTTVIFNTDPMQGDVAVTWLFSILSFSGTRLILNLRSEFSENYILSGSYTTADISFHPHAFGENQTVSQSNNFTCPNLDYEHPFSGPPSQYVT